MLLQATLLDLPYLLNFAFDSVQILCFFSVFLHCLDLQRVFHLRSELWLAATFSFALVVFGACEDSWLPLLVDFEHVGLLLLHLVSDLLNIGFFLGHVCVNEWRQQLKDSLHLGVLAQLTVSSHCLFA